ncbi:MAG: D-amino-acid transaminase [Halanaerobiales bacterium]
MGDEVYLNGKFVSYENAKVGIEDRGYQFADGVYEVIIINNGKPFKFEEHFERLQNSAEGLDIYYDNYEKLKESAYELLEKRGLEDATLYIQISRGTAPRSHAYPEGMTPNVVMKASKWDGHPPSNYEKGVRAITVSDERWSRCYIKSIALLPNILAKKEAKRSGAYEAIQIRDGFVTDGTSSNVFIVEGEKIITPPATNYLLNGITRQVILEEAPKTGVKIEERSVSRKQLLEADEVFLTGTTTEVMPVVSIDSKTIGNGEVGPISKKLYRHYRSLL